MPRIYVKLNSILGSTDERFDCPVEWEMVFPVRNSNGTFSAPKNVKEYFAGFAFKKYLNEGEIILVNNKGGWNSLSKSDRILKMYQK